jgi:hypothetical protein
MLVFRRIGGRVVPMKTDAAPPQQSRSSEKKLEAAKYIGAGVLTGLVTGAAGAKIHKFAAAHENVGHTLMRQAKKLTSTGLPGALKKAQRVAEVAQKHLTKGNSLFSFGRGVQHTGLVGSAGLIAKGVHSSLPRKNNPKRDKAVAGTAGIGSAFLIRSAYYKTINPHMKVKEAAKLAAARVSVKGAKI